jgi:hypothetical protein
VVPCVFLAGVRTIHQSSKQPTNHKGETMTIDTIRNWAAHCKTDETSTARHKMCLCLQRLTKAELADMCYAAGLSTSLSRKRLLRDTKWSLTSLLAELAGA